MRPFATVGGIKRLDAVDPLLVQMPVAIHVSMHEALAEKETDAQKDEAACNN